MKYWMAELKVVAIGQYETDMTAATTWQTPFGELMQDLEIVPGQWKMPQMIFRQERSQMLLQSVKPKVVNGMLLPMPGAVPDSSQLEIAMPV